VRHAVAKQFNIVLSGPSLRVQIKLAKRAFVPGQHETKEKMRQNEKKDE